LGVTSAKTIASGNSKGFTYEKGFQPFAFGTTIIHSDFTYKNETNPLLPKSSKKGLHDWEMFIHKKFNWFYYKLSYFLPLEESFVDLYENDENFATAGHFSFDLAAQIGSSWGLKFFYKPEYKYETSVTTADLLVDGEKVSITNGSTLSIDLYKEFVISRLILGFNYGIDSISDGKIGNLNNSGWNTIHYSIYSLLRIWQIDILYEFYTQKTPDESESVVQRKINLVGHEFKLRMNF